MTKTFIVTKVLEGMKKLKKTPCDSILPITPALFSKILLELPSVCSNRYGAFFSKHHIHWLSLHFSESGNFVYLLAVTLLLFCWYQILILAETILEHYYYIVIRWSKTDRHWNDVTMCFDNVDGHICPVAYVKDFLSSRQKLNGLLVCHFEGKPLAS